MVLEARGINNDDRQKIAAQAGYSETAFLEKSADGEYKLAFFTPARPIAYCGHATVATFGLLRSRGLESRDRVDVTISGTKLQIHFDSENNVFMEHKRPQYETLRDADHAAILAAIDVTAHQLDSEFAPQIVSTSNRFALIALRVRADLAHLQVNQDAISKLSQKLNLIGLYVFVRTEGVHGVTTRMFAPFYGIPEESATGMAAGPLVAALVESGFVHGPQIRLLQGEFMNPSQPSEIVAVVETEHSKIKTLIVGGKV